ncbi:MAG TPA: transketolase C-terminal domain-containing protein [bacterium]|nr:transketolase C-terminal domain-containing protein [bacterium]HXB98648.1 transketolase C-terminal domain-containing protein [bacterium]
MREALSSLLVERAQADPAFLVLSGDHGYALFDALRQASPSQFVNVGVCEQGMVGYAAGMAALGLKPVIYGLAAFVPMRVLEQIKLDLCYPSRPVIMLGDGAGVVYSALGSSHQCGEDLACLKPLPNLRIFSPCDEHELRACLDEAQRAAGPSYIRLGKSDRPAAHTARPAAGTAPHWVHDAPGAKACLVATGSMVSLCQGLGRELGAAVLSVPCLKPLDPGLAGLLKPFATVIVVDEHSREGGLASSVADRLAEAGPNPFPRFVAITLADQFADKVGSYQYALSEHGLSDTQVRARVQAILAAGAAG